MTHVHMSISDVGAIMTHVHMSISDVGAIMTHVHMSISDVVLWRHSLLGNQRHETQLAVYSGDTSYRTKPTCQCSECTIRQYSTINNR